MPSGFCFVGDLLGFSRLMRNLDSDERDDRVDEWVKLVAKHAIATELPEWEFISDSVFAGAPETDEGLRSVVGFCRGLLTEGLGRSFALRGAITLGEAVYEEPIPYGPGIVDAYELCESQRWVGVACEPGLPMAENLYGMDGLIVYPVPLKQGAICLRPTVAWPVPPMDEVTRLLTGRGLVPEGEMLDWPWADVVNNTVLFGLYLRRLTSEFIPSGADVANFYGTTPLQHVAHLIEDRTNPL